MNEAAKADKYKQLQLVCVLSSAAHAIALLLFLLIARQGQLDQFSVLKLMQYVPKHLDLWRLAWFFSMLASTSFLVFCIGIESALIRMTRGFLKLAMLLSAIALAIDLLAQSKMMILFSDISTQLVYGGAFARKEMLLEGWKVINESITYSLILAAPLYCCSGAILSALILGTGSLPRWLGLSSIPIWLSGFLATFLSYLGLFTMAIPALIAHLIGLSVWLMVIAVMVDHLAGAKPEQDSPIM